MTPQTEKLFGSPGFRMNGHRTYIDNPRLFRVTAWRPPVPKGHREFIEPKARGEDRSKVVG